MPTSSMTLLSARAKLPPARSPGTEQRLVHGRMVITPVTRRMPLKEQQEIIITTTTSCLAIMQTRIKQGQKGTASKPGVELELMTPMAESMNETIMVRGRAHSSPPRIKIRGGFQLDDSPAGAMATVEQKRNADDEFPAGQKLNQQQHDAGGQQLVAGGQYDDVEAEEAFFAINAGLMMQVLMAAVGFIAGVLSAILYFKMLQA